MSKTNLYGAEKNTKNQGFQLHRRSLSPLLPFEGKILELEGRVLVKSLRRIATAVFGSAALVVDNMSVALDFGRFRSRSFPLLKQIRRFSSHLLSTNISTVEPSKLLTHLLQRDATHARARPLLERKRRRRRRGSYICPHFSPHPYQIP